MNKAAGTLFVDRLVRHWVKHRLVRLPVPLTGAAALRADAPWTREEWIPVFLHAVAEEADDALQLLCYLERGWRAARGAVAGGGASRGLPP
jgi:hypothetical protein